MLRRLTIRDFVLVDRLELDFAAGFGALTGETGAGKSILVDALAFAPARQVGDHQPVVPPQPLGQRVPVLLAAGIAVQHDEGGRGGIGGLAVPVRPA